MSETFDLIGTISETFALYTQQLLPTLISRLNEYLLAPFGDPRVGDVNESIVTRSQVKIERRSQPETPPLMKDYYEATQDTNTIQYQFLNLLLDSPFITPFEKFGSFFVDTGYAEETTEKAFSCDPKAIQLCNRAGNPWGTLKTYAIWVLVLFLLSSDGSATVPPSCNDIAAVLSILVAVVSVPSGQLLLSHKYTMCMGRRA